MANEQKRAWQHYWDMLSWDKKKEVEGLPEPEALKDGHLIPMFTTQERVDIERRKAQFEAVRAKLEANMMLPQAIMVGDGLRGGAGGHATDQIGYIRAGDFGGGGVGGQNKVPVGPYQAYMNPPDVSQRLAEEMPRTYNYAMNGENGNMPNVAKVLLVVRDITAKRIAMSPKEIVGEATDNQKELMAFFLDYEKWKTEPFDLLKALKAFLWTHG